MKKNNYCKLYIHLTTKYEKDFNYNFTSICILSV